MNLSSSSTLDWRLAADRRLAAGNWRLPATIGLAAGMVYTLSPLAVICAVWMAFVFRWAATGTTAAERRWVIGALGLALAIRVVSVAVLPLTLDPAQHAFTSYFGDAFYAIQRSIWIRNVFLGIPIAARDHFEAFEPQFGYSGYNYLLAYLHVLFGPSPYGIALFSTALFLTAAVMLYRRCRAAFGPLAAFCGFAAVIFMPTWLAWSVAPLKEAMQIVLVVGALEATVIMVRDKRKAVRLASVAVIVIAAVVSGTLRNGGAAILLASVVFGVALYLVTRRWWILAAVVVLVVPVSARVAARLMERPAIRERAIATVLDAAKRNVGHTLSPGASYRLLEERFYLIKDFPGPVTMTLDEGVRFLVRAPLAFLTMPLPWALDSPRWAFFIPQQVIWYAMLVLSLFGAAAGARRDALVTCLLLGAVAAIVAVIAPNSGNIGTAIRHRDLIVPFVAALAGVGGLAVVNRFAQFRVMRRA